jgi:NAD(P)-dependent dehydrogenase (short-subunit alcohol dehydrogenase family)
MVSEEFSLNGKIALVAGDSEYWSKYIATALAQAGADVAVAANNPYKVNEAVDEVRHCGRRALPVLGDITKPAQVEKIFDQVLKEFGRLDILVNAGNLECAKPFIQTTPHEWERLVAANLGAVFHSCQAAGKQILKQKKGRIINISSCLAERGLANTVAYTASIGGVVSMTRALALEWAREGITVNTISVGWIAEHEKTGAAGEDKLLRYLPMKRYGRPDEIGSLVVYLASDATGFVTGQVMSVDGAVMAHM